MPSFPRYLTLIAAVLAVTCSSAVAFQYGTLYTFKTQPRLAESGRADTGWYFASTKTGNVYPRTTTMMREGGFSDLVLDPTDATGHTFFTVQDRGLAVSFENDHTGDTAFKIFAFPGHRQKLVRIRVQGDSVEVLSRDSIGGLDSGFVTGLPSTRVPTEEVAVRMRLDSAVVNIAAARRVNASPNGYDFEGLARAADGTFYLADEMGPRIVRVNASTKRITREWSPGSGLPHVLARRRDNRGLESLCLTPSGKLAALMQAGLYNTASGKRSNTKDSTRVLRFVLLDPATDSVREYVYLADLKGGSRKPGEVKTGAMTCLSDTSFLVLEHGKDGSGYDWIDIHRVEIRPQTSDVHEANDVTGNGRLFQGGLKTLEQLGYIPGDSANLVAAGVTPMLKKLVYGDVMQHTPWPHDTPEGLARVNDSTIALINDNNYAQSDEDGDGIPHLVGNTKRQTHLMYLNVGPGPTTATRSNSFAIRPASHFTVRPINAGWMVHGPLGTTARLINLRGRVVLQTHPSTEASFQMPAQDLGGVYLLDLRVGTHREVFRITAPQP
jgi:hypothetical protein